MLNPDLFLIVIAGGTGTRFWPKSTSKCPKQFLSFSASSKDQNQQSTSLLTQTVSRFESFVPPSQQFIVTTQALKGGVQQLNLKAEILSEPQGRNTAPCIYWAARKVAQINPKGVMLVMPSDHYIANVENFTQVVRTAAEWAGKTDDLVTLGICPTRPETGYGYLKTSRLHSGVKKVDVFVEKPNLEKAEEFLRSGDYLWNGGMFLWRADVILRAFDQYMPEMKKVWDSCEGRVEEAYPKMTATSIDYGIMEKAQNVVTFPLECGWDDLGSWTSLDNLADVLGTRQESNIMMDGELIAIDSTQNIVDAPKKLVALLGVDQLIVVEHGDSILVAHRSRAQEIRRMVDEVKKKRPELV